jgi:hypothetical protein
VESLDQSQKHEFRFGLQTLVVGASLPISTWHAKLKSLIVQFSFRQVLGLLVHEAFYSLTAMPGNLNGSQTSAATFVPSDALFLGRKLRWDIKSIFLKCRDENIKSLESNSTLRRICYFILSTGELIRLKIYYNQVTRLIIAGNLCAPLLFIAWVTLSTFYFYLEWDALLAPEEQQHHLSFSISRSTWSSKIITWNLKVYLVHWILVYHKQC